MSDGLSLARVDQRLDNKIGTEGQRAQAAAFMNRMFNEIHP
jgi:hypothetical protein